jgi:hypothetical protein
MKFLGAIIAYLVIAFFIGWGIYLLTVKGSFWMLAFAVLAYLVAFVKFGCLPPSKSH